jgi:hypothetical protein
VVKQEANDRVKFMDEPVCERYGKFGAFQFEGSLLCSDCYQERGSCCPEFGADDLWATRE